MLKSLRLLLERVGLRKPPDIELADKWFVQLNGEPVAVLSNPRFEEMFWFSWNIEPTEEEIPDKLWSYENDERRSFRHCANGYCDKGAFPATDNPVMDDGRVLIRGPLCHECRRQSR